MALQFDNFNWRIGQWEPIVEQCSLVLEAVSNPTGELSLRFSMAKRLEVVLSDDAINALHGASYRIREAFTAPLDVLVAGRSRPPYAISNETGVTIRFCKPEYDPRGAAGVELGPGCVEALTLWEHEQVCHDLHTISIEVLGRWRPALPVPVSRLGSCMVNLERAEELSLSSHILADQSSGHAVVCRVELRDEGSSTLLRICSLVQVVNLTEKELELGVRSSVKVSCQ